MPVSSTASVAPSIDKLPSGPWVIFPPEQLACRTAAKCIPLPVSVAVLDRVLSQLVGPRLRRFFLVVHGVGFVGLLRS